jgi:hypothetical protein
MNKINKLLIVAVFLAIVSVAGVGVISAPSPVPVFSVSVDTLNPTDAGPIQISVNGVGWAVNNTSNATVTLTDVEDGTIYTFNGTFNTQGTKAIVNIPGGLSPGTYSVSAIVNESDNDVLKSYGPFDGSDLIVTHEYEFDISYSPSPVHVGDTVTAIAVLKNISNPNKYKSVFFTLVTPIGEVRSLGFSLLNIEPSRLVAYATFKAELSGQYTIYVEGNAFNPIPNALSSSSSSSFGDPKGSKVSFTVE